MMRKTILLGLVAALIGGLPWSSGEAAMIGPGGDVKGIAISPDGGRVRRGWEGGP